MAGEDLLQIRITADFKEVESAFLNLGKTAKSFESDIRKVSANVSKEFNKIEGTATLFGDASNVVKDKMDTLRAAMERLMAMGLQPANKYVQELKTKYDQLATSLVVVEKVTKTTSTVNNDAATALKKSNQQYTNFALVLQDLPYGFRGIQNNLPALMGGIAGMAGPFYLVGSAVIALFTAWDQGSFKAMEAIDRVAEAHKRKSDVLKKGAEAESDAVVEMAKMSALFEGVKSGSVSAEYALSQYNETLGKTFGEAKNLNDAEDAFMSKTGAYVKSIALRAMADEKYEQAKKAFREGREAAGKDQTNFLQKFAAGMDALDEVGIMGMDIASMTKWASSFSRNISETQKVLVNDAVNLASSSFDLFIAEGNNFVKEANKLQSAFGIKGKGGKTTKTPTAKKDNTLEKAQDVQIQNYIDSLSERNKEIVKSELKLQDDIAALNAAGFTNYENAYTANRNRIDAINLKHNDISKKYTEQNRKEMLDFEAKVSKDLEDIENDKIKKAKERYDESLSGFKQFYNNQLDLATGNRVEQKAILEQQMSDLAWAYQNMQIAPDDYYKTMADLSKAWATNNKAINNEVYQDNKKLADSIANGLTGAITGMFESLKNGESVLSSLGTMLGNLAQQFVLAALRAAIFAGVMAILTGGTSMAASGAGLLSGGGGLGGVSTMLGSLIGFANGGIISGPTMGLMGEYPGAQNNPEVVAPLDKLKDMIGGGGGGQFVLRGQDLLVALNRTQKTSNLKGQNISLA
jgi:hypothetical protein